jgi:ring-1,2-phenylacetyl-CoA epoxidase subunit PaaC
MPEAAPALAATPAGAPDRLSPELAKAWRGYLTALADDEMLLGHRDAEWTGLGPVLEEDIAFSSMAQDELGHALAWYSLLEHEIGAPPPDEQAFLRGAPLWRNCHLVELPRGDYAFSLVRRYLFDVAESLRYEALERCPWPPVADTARKLRQEEKYHLIHGRTYMIELGRAGGESRERLQAALDALWPYALGIWETPDGEDELVEAGLVTPSAQLATAWLDLVVPLLLSVGLRPAVEGEAGSWRSGVPADEGGRRGRHGPELAALLEAMQGLYRSDPEAAW